MADRNDVRHLNLAITLLVFILALGGCIEQIKKSEIPVTGHEPGAKTGTSNKNNKISTGALSGAIAGGALGASIGTLAGHLLGTIEVTLLTPQQLSELFVRSLRERHLVAPSVPSIITAQSFVPGKIDNQLSSQWTISDYNSGQIITDWKSIQGKQTGILFWRKYYEAEVRHIITIRPISFTKYHCIFTIATEVRERPNENYNWAQGNPELGRQSFEQIRMFLLETIDKNTPKRTQPTTGHDPGK